jgi:hypothetical protein
MAQSFRIVLPVAGTIRGHAEAAWPRTTDRLHHPRSRAGPVKNEKQQRGLHPS